MKLALLAALITLGAAQYYRDTPTSVIFKPGVEYVYHYKGHVLSGIPKASTQYAGLLIDTLVVLQFQQDYKVVLKLEKIKLFKLNNKISTPPLETLNENELTLLTGEQASVIIEQLVKPMKFRYVEGEIRELEKETHDRYWSVNIKKGILSLFQVTLKEKTTTTDPVYYDPTMSILKQGSTNNIPFWKLSRKSNTVYKAVETDVTGICETKYSVITDKTTSTSSFSTMKVTAVRDFDSCTTEPFHVRGLFQGVYVYPEEEDLLHPMVHTDYVITGDRSHFLIKEATLRGKYTFMLHGLQGGDMTTFILQKLTLKTTESIQTPLRMSSPKPCTLGLMMVIPDSLTEKKTFEELPRSSWLPPRSRMVSGRIPETVEPYGGEYEPYVEETGDVLAVAETLLTEIVSCMHQTETNKPCSDYLYRLDRVIRRIPKEQLKPFVLRYVTGIRTSEVEYRKSEILLDLLPTLSSTDSALVVIDLIREHVISKLRGSLMIKGLVLTVKPTPVVVRSLLELYKELEKETVSKLGSITLLRQSLLLGVGTVTHRMINVMRSHGKPQPEILNFIEIISGELKKLLEESSTEPEKILVLKSIGNMGAVQSILLLKNLAEDPRQPTVIRITSIYALRRLSKQFGKQVIPILMSIYMDTKEVRELRQAAFLIIIKSKPGFTTLEMIGHKLRHEPSSQLRTLVYTTLINLAEHTSHVPEHKELKENARLILKNIKPVSVGFHDSYSVKLNAFSEKFDLGGAINVMKIKSKTSGLPEALIANLQGMLLGKHRSIVEFGAEGKGLEVLIRKIFGPHGILKDILKGKVSLKDFVQPLTRPNMGEIEYKIREILQRMMIETRSETKPFGSWYIHVLRNEIQYMLFNTENVEELASKITTVVPELIMKLKRGIEVDIIKSVSHITSLHVSSPIGLPISLNYSVSGIFKVNGHVKINDLPTWSDVINRKPLPRVSLDVDLKPHIDVSTYLTYGVNMRWLSTLVGISKHIKSHVPVKLTTTIDPIKHTVSLKYFTPKESALPLHITIIPRTGIKYYPMTPAKLPFIIEMKEIHNENIVKVIPFERSIRCPLTGMNIETKGRVSSCGPLWCPFMPLVGKQELLVKAHPTSSVEFIVLEIKSLKTNFDIEGVPASYRTEHLFDEYETTYETGMRTYPESVPTDRTTTEFEPITTDPIFTSEPIKRQILVTLRPSSQSVPKVKGLFTWLMGRTYWKNQIDMQLICTHLDNPALKLHWNTVVNPLAWQMPEVETMYVSRSTEFLSKSLLKWSILGERQEIKVKIIPGSPVDFSKELKEHDILTAFTLPEARVQKIKYTAEIEFTHMGRKTLKYISLSHDLLRYLLLSHVTTSIPINPHSNKITIGVEVLPYWEQANIIVKTPLRNSYITKVPFYWNPLFPTKEKLMIHDSPAWTWYNTSVNEYEPTYEDEFDMDETTTVTNLEKPFPYRTTPIVAGECTIDGSSMTVNTFDDFSSTFRPIRKFSNRGCEIVLVQDCSNQGLFSVVTTGLGTTGTWKLKYLIPKYEIELIKPSLTSSSPYTSTGTVYVRINGEERTIHRAEPIVLTDPSPESEAEVAVIEKLNEGTIEVKLRELGIKFIVDIENSLIKAKMSPFSTLQGSLCGVCGNYNLDQSDEYTVPEYMKIPRTRNYYESNIIPSDTCDIERISDTEDDEEIETCSTENYLTVNRYEDETPMTCTSVKKVKQCSPGCRPVTVDSIKTCFRCSTESGMTRNFTPYAPRWDTMDTSVDCEDFYTRVEIPIRCVPVY
jgi:hypothetical protein